MPVCDSVSRFGGPSCWKNLRKSFSPPPPHASIAGNLSAGSPRVAAFVTWYKLALGKTKTSMSLYPCLLTPWASTWCTRKQITRRDTTTADTVPVRTTGLDGIVEEIDTEEVILLGQKKSRPVKKKKDTQTKRQRTSFPSNPPLAPPLILPLPSWKNAHHHPLHHQTGKQTKKVSLQTQKKKIGYALPPGPYLQDPRLARRSCLPASHETPRTCTP